MEIIVNVVLEIDDGALEKPVGRTAKLTTSQKAAAAAARMSVQDVLEKHLGTGLKVASVGMNPPWA